MKRLRTYSLEWLDALISVSLNPEKPYRGRLNDTDIKMLLEKLPEEALKIRSELNLQFFSLNKDSQVRHLVQKYNDALKSLHKAVTQYQQTAVPTGGQLKALETLALECLAELLNFIAARFTAYIPRHTSNAKAESPSFNSGISHVPDRHKVLCTLSADQIALILRAADESQLLKARSMNAVFKFIIPFLSTPRREVLSATAVRSKAYNPEEADRDAAVAALEKLIKKIQGY